LAGIALTITTGGVGKLAADAVCTAIDVAQGKLTWDEGLFSIAQAGISTFASAQIGGFFEGAKIVDPSGIAQVVHNTVIAGTETLANNVVGGAINSVTYKAGGEFGFDTRGYIRGIVGTEAVAGYLGSMAGEFVDSGLRSMWLGKGIPDAEGKIGSYNKVAGWIDGKDTKVDNIRSLTGTIGNLVHAGIDFGLTGDTTINILNASDFIPGLNSRVGLFELTIDSERGISSRIGMDGIDLSIGKIADSFKGISALNLNAQIVAESKRNLGYGVNAEEKAATMRATLDFGTWEEKQLIMNTLSGKDRLFMMQNVSGDGLGKTIENVGGGRDVFMRSSGSSNIIDWISGAITVSHEAVRTGRTEADNDKETRQAVDAHGDMADKLEAYFGTGVLRTKQMVFLDRLAKEKGEDTYRKYIASVYDSSEDFWTIRMEDGKMAIQYDFENNVYFEYQNEKGVTEKILLFTHNQQDWEKIQQLEAAYKGTGSAAKKQELDALKGEYNKLENTGYITDKLGAMLLYGNDWESNYKSIAHSGGLGEYLVKDIEDQMRNRGFSHDNEFIWNVTDDNAANMKFDITDYFLSSDFSGNDRARVENVIGNSALCDSKLFDALHKNYFEGKAIDYAQAFLDSTRDITQDYSAEIKAQASDILGKIRNDFGLYDSGYYMPIGEGSTYDRRLYSYISRNKGLVEEKVRNAYLYNYKSQNYGSDKLGWGFLDQTNYNNTPQPKNLFRSSLCVGYSLADAVELNNLVNVTDDERVEYFKKLKDLNTNGKDILFYGGIPLIKPNGWITDPYMFSKTYAQKIEGAQLPIDLIDNSARYGEARNAIAGHSASWDYDTNSKEWDPYTLSILTNHFDASASKRFTYIWDVLRYNFWEN